MGSFLSGCSDKSSIDDSLLKKSLRDGVITNDEWQSLVQAAQKDAQFMDNDNFSYDKLKRFLEEYALTELKGIDTVKFDSSINFTLGSLDLVTDSISVKLYIERSGSMVPYDSKQSKGEFKKSLVTLLNNLPMKTNECGESLYIVNNAVYPYGKNLRDFIKSKDIFEETKGIGDPRYTDFTCIFDSILSHTQSNELSILVSDMIFSTKDMGVINTEKILNEAESLTTAIFKDHENMDVAIIKMIADFDGQYYPYNSPSKGVHYNGNRPYYIMMVAQPNVMHNVFLNEEFKDFRNFKGLPGYKDFYLFSTSGSSPDYSILLNSKYNRGRFRASKGQSSEIHSIENFKSDRDGNNVIAVGVDLSKVISPENFKTDINNYIVKSSSGFKLKEINKVTPNDERSLHNVPSATHIFILESDDVQNDNICISLLNKLPNWILETNSTDDSDISKGNFEQQTFAFGNMMEGIHKAFFSSTTTPTIFTMSLKLKK